MTACSTKQDEVAPQAVVTAPVVAEIVPAAARIAADAVEVQTYGAKGDGQNDDTESIQKAIKSNPGKQIVFRAGVYKVSKVIKLDVSKVELVGVGEVKLQSTQRSIIELGNVTDVTFTNLSFESLSQDASTYYFGLVFSNKKTIKGLTFTGCTFTAATCSTAGVKLVTDAVNTSVSNLEVTNCTFKDLGNMGIEIQNHLTDGVERFSNLTIRNNVFRNLGLNENAAYHHGMAVSLSGKGSNLVIANNTIINPYNLGIELAGAVKDAQILQNQFSALNRMNKEENRPLALIAISSFSKDLHENVKIIGNQNLSGTDNAYLFLGNINNATVEGNTFNTKTSALIRNVSNSTFKNNTIISRGSNAVVIESTDYDTQNNTFINSTLTCTGSTAVEAVVKFTGAKTARNVISNSKLARSASSSKFMVETNSANGNILKDCTLNN